MFSKSILAFALFIAASPLSAAGPEQELRRLALRQRAAQANAWEDPYWQKLLYYEKSLLGRVRSASLNPKFFLAKWGSINPRLELEAAIDGLYHDGADNDSPECLFPERYRWLKEKLAIPAGEFPPRACSSFENWKAGLDVESVSLLFAAGYLNNPSTLYGHTFLRLHKRGAGGADLLDYTLNYAAISDEQSGLFFALKGLVGAYPGQFATIPYYLKIQEYHNIENRDLWEFPLNLKPEEIDRLLRHCWELGKSSFPYLFFTRNCSWQLLPLLDIVKPELDVSRRFSFWVIPSDTAKAVLQASPPAAPGWRPSLWKTVDWKRSQLNPEERQAVLGLAKRNQAAELKKLESMHYERRAAVLEAAVDYLSWRFYARRIGKTELDYRTDPLLAARAPLGQVKTFTGAPSRPSSIVEAHESLRLGAGLVSLKNGPAYELQARFAMQDLLDDPTGYLPDAALEMGSLRLRYEPRYNRYYLREAKLARVLSLNPWDAWVQRQSWEINAGLEQAPETGRQSGRAAVWAMNAGSGLAVEWDGPVRQLWYAMLQADSAFGPALRENWRLGGGVKAGVLLEKDKFRGLAEARYLSYALGDTRPLWAGSLAASYKLAKDTSLRGEYSWRGEVKEAGLYFHQFLFAP
jgi:phage tail protein X